MKTAYIDKIKNMTFPDFIKQRRKELGYTLRAFCKNKGYDPSYISRLENGLLNPPLETSKREGLALALEFEEGTPEWVTFFDLVNASNYQLPEDIKENFPQIVSFLPAFYRTIRKKEMSSADIQDLVNLLKADEPED